ncbi:MAG: HEAT repeat domain-containing protein [Anaerolineae bacterium]|nr:HEAT repeat domain-containing protein [Anaerolineae bacterium]
MVDIALRRAIEKLAAPDPAVREEGIRALEVLGDTGGLPALADVFATDSDPALRALAQQVGKAIYYGAVRQALEAYGASDEERRQAAAILNQARAKKSKGR